jgi:hypothetical protein
LAERTTNSQVKAVLTYLAEHWLKTADDLEHAQEDDERLLLRHVPKSRVDAEDTNEKRD